MKLKLGSFAEKAPNKVFIAVILGALAGAAYTLIIPMVLSVLNPEKLPLLVTTDIAGASL